MTGKTVVLTGATSGIGRAAAVQLVSMGAGVAILARDGERASDAEREIARLGEEAWREAVERHTRRAAAQERAAARRERNADGELLTGFAAAYAAPLRQDQSEDGAGEGIADEGRSPDGETNEKNRNKPPPEPGKVRTVECDLASIASVRKAADQLLAELPRIHVLINNAGVFPRRRRETADGYELTFAVNHLGHFLLTNLLLPRLAESAPARIVVVTCSSHRLGELQFDDLQSERRYRPFRAYAQSKIANVLFVRELAQRLDGTGVTVNALHPGTVGTALFSSRRGEVLVAQRILHALLWPVFRTPERGAQPLVSLASDPALQNVSGRYFYDMHERAPSPEALNAESARHLWEVSEALVNGR